MKKLLICLDDELEKQMVIKASKNELTLNEYIMRCILTNTEKLIDNNIEYNNVFKKQSQNYSKRKEYIKIYQRERRGNNKNREKDNYSTKKYHKTVRGIFALKAGNINSSAKRRKSSGNNRLSSIDLINLFLENGGEIKDDQIIGYPKCNICCYKIIRYVDIIYDHITPLIMGGENIISNIQILCADCHKTKTNKEKEFLRKQW